MNILTYHFYPPPGFNNFIEKIRQLSLSPEQIERLRELKEQEIQASLTKLNNDIYQNEKG